MKHTFGLFFLLLSFAVASSARSAEDPFSLNIRDTPPLTPAQEQKALHLPPGFAIQLVASEPEIHKPLDLAFDSRGRLWMTQTHMYPFPAKPGKPKLDSIIVLEDVKGDGSFSKITTFADNLSIPMGIYPMGDGHRVIAFDCGDGPTGQTCLYTDTDGDGKADKKQVLYTGWGFDRDTHGLSSNYRRGFDGWIYGLHGFNNISNVKGSDGQVMHLRSGNSYRFRMDGSHIERYTEGQINPHGMCFDPLGNIFDSDSHSKPIYELLRGGKYEAFDRNCDDGLGLAPMMMHHLHGSTALAGSLFYADDKFPPEYQNDVFTGNVVTCRIDLDHLVYHGSSPKAIEQPDFLSTDDPWFRPVCIVLGPDGAMYVSDFYNRIIGHYEVPLTDPRRDYKRGRVWRIRYKGMKPRHFDVSKDSADQLIPLLNDSNLTVRMLAISELSDRIGGDAIAPMTALITSGKATANQKIGAIWVLHRLGALPVGLLQQVASSTDSSVRVHAMRALAESSDWSPKLRALALKRLSDSDALVRRCAADALETHPQVENVRPLLDVLEHADQQDTHLVYVLRRSLLSQLQLDHAYAKLPSLTEADVRPIADVSLAVDDSDAATFILNHISQLPADKETLTKYIEHAVRFATTPDIAPLETLASRRFPDDLDLQLELLQSIQQGLEQRGRPVPDQARKWAEKVARAALQSGAASGSDWTCSPIEPGQPLVIPWSYEKRGCADGHEAMLLSSHPGGESATSILRSKPFTVPSKLSFYLAGHNGYPKTHPRPVNFVRLRAVGSNRILVEALPPRNDQARQIVWDLHDYAGQLAYLEITDGDSGSAYAWLALGRFEPEVVALPQTFPLMIQNRLRSSAELAGSMQLTSVSSDLIGAMLDAKNETETRRDMAGALAAIHCGDAVRAMNRIVNDSTENLALRDDVAQSLGALGTPAAQQAIIASFKLAPTELQTSLAAALTAHTSSAQALLDAVRSGQAPARLLLEPGMRDRLVAAGVRDADSQIKNLTRGIAPPREALEKLIAQRRAAYRTSHPSPAAGRLVFEKNCMVCHTIDGQGGLVGPQLAGLSKRGIDRLVEDVLDPNANVDPAFRYSNIILKDGQIITGLQKKEEGDVLTFAESTGKLVQIKKSDIRRRIESPASLMPTNFGEILRADDFNKLMAYLLTK